MAGPPIGQVVADRPDRTPATVVAMWSPARPMRSLGRARPRSGPAECLAMLGRDAGSPAAFQNGMDGDDVALIENADHVG